MIYALSCLSRKFDIRQRFLTIVTDAPLDASPLYTLAAGEYACADCTKMCITRCPAKAISSQETTLLCDGEAYSFRLTDNLLCDWTKRYTLRGGSGFKYLGSTVDINPGTDVTAKNLSNVLKYLDPIKKYRPVVAEPCVINCSYGNVDAKSW